MQIPNENPARGRLGAVLLLLVLGGALAAQPMPAPWPSPGATPTATNPASLTLGTPSLDLELVDGVSGLGIARIGNAAIGDLFFEDTGFFRLHVRRYGSGVPVTLTPGDFQNVAWIDAGDTAFLIFSQPSETTITVTVRIWNVDGGFDWDLRVDNPGRTHTLERTDFPVFRPLPINPARPLNDALVTPLFGGSAVLNVPLQPPLSFPAPSNVGMQVFCYYDQAASRGLYWQTKDGTGFRKEYRVEGRMISTDVRISQYGVNDHRPGNDYESPYSVSLTSFAGNWYDAAVRYREWALEQRWLDRGRLWTTTEFSAKARDLKLHLLQYPDHLVPFDDFGSLVTEAEEVRDLCGLASNEIATLWSDWNGRVYNSELPDFETVRSSVPSALADAESEGIHVLPYIHVELWSDNAPITAQLGVDRWAYIDRFGNRPITYVGPSVNELNRAHFRVDSAFAGARLAKNQVITDLFTILPQGSTWDGVYLDTWSAVAPELNYNRNLRWEQGGTANWELGRSLEGTLFRQTMNSLNPGGMLTSESPNESVLHHADLVYYHPFTLSGVQVPFWESVYHGYVLTSNLESTTPGRSDIVPAMLDTIQYDYHLGKILGLSNYFAGARSLSVEGGPGGAYEPIYEFIRATLVMEDAVREHRVYGRRMRPLETSIERSIETLDYFFTGAPDVSASVWLAPSGSLGILVSNSASTTKSVTLNLDFADYEISGDHELFETDAASLRTFLSTESTSLTLPVTLSGYGVRFFELLPAP